MVSCPPATLGPGTRRALSVSPVGSVCRHASSWQPGAVYLSLRFSTEYTIIYIKSGHPSGTSCSDELSDAVVEEP